MRVLMLGNSFTYFNGMPEMLKAALEEKTGEETVVTAHTRGGAMLAEQYNPETEMGARTLAALKDEKWDYVVLQEQSHSPVTKRKCFQASADTLCGMIRANGAEPVFYATWAYRDGSEKLAGMGMDYDAMFRGLYDSYHEAADRNGAPIADVGAVFYRLTKTAGVAAPELLRDDDYHPTRDGSLIAANEIARVIAEREREKAER
ncbi:MAG: SGNH/GDSL hydrolase family protein [Oscillospiraceae bacterium]|nr:SGNH/GDSL hydrolase family protein [Oscillospiraceae bacterium]